MPVLSAAHRLRHRREFQLVVRSGLRAGRASLVAYLQLPGVDAGGGQVTEPVRVGLVVSGGVGNAVVRNRVRRRLRHLVRDRLRQLPVGSRLVIRALPAAGSSSSADLGAELDSALATLLRRAGTRVDQPASTPAGR